MSERTKRIDFLSVRRNNGPKHEMKEEFPTQNLTNKHLNLKPLVDNFGFLLSGFNCLLFPAFASEKLPPKPEKYPGRSTLLNVNKVFPEKELVSHH